MNENRAGAAGRRYIKLILAYDGTDFKGWQRLPGAHPQRTVQDTVERCLERALGAGAEVSGAGRTDAGVHAEAQAASFPYSGRLSAEGIKDALNAVLPPDLSCLEAQDMGERFHARYSATGKTYRYRVLNRREPNPFLRRYSLHVPQPLDLEAMRAAGAALLGTHNFQAFTNLKEKEKSFERNLDSIKVERHGDLVDLVFHADGFLRNQVRIMSQALIDCGLGKLQPAELGRMLESRERAQAPGMAGAFGLCLVSVDY
jgi:tRNA pseudouridine38-40 synthase